MAIWNLINWIGKVIPGVCVDAETKEDAQNYGHELYDCSDVDLDRSWPHGRCEEPEKPKWKFWN